MRNSKYHMRIVATMMPLPFSSLNTSLKEVASSSHQSFVGQQSLILSVLLQAAFAVLICFKYNPLKSVLDLLMAHSSSCLFGPVLPKSIWQLPRSPVILFHSVFLWVFSHLFKGQSLSGDACEKLELRLTTELNCLVKQKQ